MHSCCSVLANYITTKSSAIFFKQVPQASKSPRSILISGVRLRLKGAVNGAMCRQKFLKLYIAQNMNNVIITVLISHIVLKLASSN